MTLLFAKTNDKKYLDAADELIDWSEYNLKTMDGLWYNDITNRWYATSEFSALSIGEAIYHFGDIIPADIKEKWMNIFIRMCDVFITLDKRRSFAPVTNYYCGMTAVLAMAWKLTGNKKYLEKTKYWLDEVLTRFDDDSLLYGEGYPMDTPKGMHTVDMGYDLEESLPLLLRYADLTGDKKDFIKDKFISHLEFLLPDGAIDNSFGTRHNKWTYWGSRTSDGIIEGLALLLDDPICATACERVLSLYESCTHDGLLAMPMAHEVNEPTCLHHTFCHAKALASLICAEKITNERAALPCEIPYGIKKYQKDSIILLSNKKWRATFSSCDCAYLHSHVSNGGGTLNLLYHKEKGILCAATSSEYIPTEITNQQYLRNSDDPPSMTPQFIIDGAPCCKEKNAKLSSNGLSVLAEGEKWSAEYIFDDDNLTIVLSCEKGIYNFPIVCSKSAVVDLNESKSSIKIGDIEICSTSPIICNTDNRVFHQIGGLLYLPLSVEVTGKVTITIK